VSRAPVDGGVGPAGDDDPGALTSYIGEVAGVETFTFATSRTFCVLDKVLVALGRTKVVYSLYVLLHPATAKIDTTYICACILYIYMFRSTPTSPLTKSHHERHPATKPATRPTTRNGRKPFETLFIYMYLL